jgi:hypothetical protein
MNSAADFESGHSRRHSDPPNLWLAVLAGSLILHLLFLLSGRWYLVRVSANRARGEATPIEVVNITPGKATGGTRSAKTQALTAAKAAQSVASSGNTSAQRSTPTQPAASSVPPSQPSVAPRVTRSTPTPLVTPQVRNSPLTEPRPQTQSPSPSPIDPARPNPSQPSTQEPPFSTTPPDATDSNPAGESDPDRKRPSGVTEPGSPDDNSPNPNNSGLPGPLSPGTPLAQELSVESTIGTLTLPPGRQTSSESATLRGSSLQTIAIENPPALGLNANEVLNLVVYVTIQNNGGKVLSTELPPDQNSILQQPGVDRAGLESVVKRVFQDLSFDVKVDAPPGTAPAPLSDWFVPVQIRIVK